MNGEFLLDQITPMVITFNEEPNLKRCLDKLTWAKRILVIDSGSTDATLAIARSFPQVVVVHRAFDSFAQQCNFGLTQVATRWVLSMDCDYELSDDLVAELKTLRKSEITAYTVAFVYRMYGRPLRGTLYPPRAALYRVDGAAYRDEGHGHRIVVTGPKGKLAAKIFHDDRKPLSRWLGSQQRYAKQRSTTSSQRRAPILAASINCG